MHDLQTIASLDDFQAAKARSHQRPVFVFKHSTRCGVSSWAWGQFEAFRRQAAKAAADTEAWRVLVVENRAVSQAIAADVGVVHQSPQVLLLRDGRVRWHASHNAITPAALAEALAAAQAG